MSAAAPPGGEAAYPTDVLVVDGEGGAAHESRRLLRLVTAGSVDVVADARAARDAEIAPLSLCIVRIDAGPRSEVLELVRALVDHSAAPHVVVACSPAQGGLIAEAVEAGARGYLRHSLRQEELGRCMESVQSAEGELKRLARFLVGRLGVKEATRLLRGEMMNCGLERSNFSRRAAAKVLGVDRRVVQRAIVGDDVPGGPRR